MGSYKEERDLTYQIRVLGKTLKACIACSASFLISMAGALMLGWWALKYHPTNSQLWMVPFGLILLVTPLISWFSAFVSDIWGLNQSAVVSRDHSVHDPESEI